MPERIRFICLLITLACWLPPTALANGPTDTLPAAVVGTLRAHKIDAGSVSVFIQAVDAPEPLLIHNDTVLRSPASVIKLLTTYAALDTLGPGYRWYTEAWGTGPVRGGRLEGDLVLRGGGDPALSTERYWTMLRELRARGVHDIAGGLIVDDTLFAPHNSSPGDFDRQPYRAYNVLPNALLVSHNAVQYRVMRSGAGIGVYLDPPLHGFHIENRITSAAGACEGFQRGIAFDLPGGLEGGRASLSGAFPTGCREFTLYRAALSAPRFADAVFRALWQQLGGEIGDGLRVGPVPENATLIYRHPSTPLSDQVREANKWSNNAMTRHMLLTMGVERFGPPGTVEKGRAALGEWMTRRGLAEPGVFVDNGSGLSRETRISARVLGRMLLDAWQHPQMADLVSSMPISAVDGTLRQRYNRDMTGRLYLKTGRLDDVSAIAGIAQSRSGQRYVVVIIVNASNAHQGPGTAIQDALLRWVFER